MRTTHSRRPLLSESRAALTQVENLVRAARSLKWNAVDGFDQHSNLIVSRDSWRPLRDALAPFKDTP